MIARLRMGKNGLRAVFFCLNAVEAPWPPKPSPPGKVAERRRGRMRPCLCGWLNMPFGARADFVACPETLAFSVPFLFMVIVAPGLP